MYINKIDELIEKVIDDLYLLLLENKTFSTILKDPDFIKFQKEINELMVKVSQNVNFTQVKDIVKSSEATNQIVETIKRYIAFYIFLTIGFFYSDKNDKFVSNIIEFSKNQPGFGFKIENFFNSVNNALLIKYNTMISNILGLLDNKIKDKSRPDLKETIDFLNNVIGADFISEHFILKNLNGNARVQAHNIIKTVIVKLLYEKEDKKDFFKFIESSEITDAEYVYIDIVVPIKKTIDFSVIENLLGTSPKARLRAINVWNYFNEYRERLSKPPLTNDEKISTLINSEIIVPIVDDFLLYHRESEKYDKTIDVNKVKKKEDTKIKYIVGKIDRVKDLYSEQIKFDEKYKAEIKKLFYVPLLNRKAVLVNILEDISIINKFVNIGRQSAENIDLFKDLEQYHIYPYINFNEFNNYGFSLTMNKTVDMVRSVSFVKTGDFKQLSSSNFIQTRIGSKDMMVNIVGFMVPSTNVALPCIKIKNLSDIRDMDKDNKNGLDLMVKYLRSTAMNLLPSNRSVSWFFDEELDTFKLKRYEQESKFTMQDRIKHIIGELYDRIQEEAYYAISNIFSQSEKLTVQEGYNVIRDFEEALFTISKDSDVYIDIEKDLFSSVITEEPEYDYNEDKFYEVVDEKSRALSIDVKKKKKNIVEINLSEIDEFGELRKKEIVEGICQHNITIERIDSIDKTDFIRYSDELHKFIQQYVTVNVHNEYICKSCGVRLDLEQYIEDGEYNDETRTFEAYSMPIEINLEEVIGYEKYKIAIRQIDKMVEKIATVSNLLHLAKTSVDVKSKRKLVVKNTLDLLIANNKNLKKIFKERKSEINKLYGINPNYTALWNFELENNIFVFSSKDIDQFKLIKINNIIAYSIFFIILELNQTHVQYMGTVNDKKKTCHFTIFDKIMDSLFGNLKIIVNNRGDTKNITDYKILCYIIYVISCTISSQTKMWHLKVSDSEKKIMPLMQRSIIHTVIDILNSVLEIGKDKQDNALYGMNSVRFFKRLQDLFSDEELYLRLKRDTQASRSFERKESILLQEGLVPLTGKFEHSTFDIPKRILCKPSTMVIPKYPIKYGEYYGISNLSNCPDGNYHVWKTNGAELICSLCKVSANELKYNPKLSEEIRDVFKDVLDKEIAKEICIVDGLPHTFEIGKNGEEICSKCKRNREYEYTQKEIQNLKVVIEERRKEKSESIQTTENKITEETIKQQVYINTVVQKLTDEYFNSNNTDFMYRLTDEIQKIVGKEVEDTNLVENVYIIDHDHLGNPLNTSIRILESQNKMIEKLNHPYFKTDVLYYTSYKQRKIDVFYDAHTRILLGYKEENKDYILNKKHNRSIQFIPSIINKLKLLGYPKMFIDISEVYDEITELRKGTNLKLNDPIVTEEIIRYIINSRISRLKKVLFYLKIVLSRIINGYVGVEKGEDENYNKEKIDSLIDKYQKKKMNPFMSDKSGNGLVLKHWKSVNNGVLMGSMNDIKLDFDFEKNKSVHYSEINKIDETGNIITYYIIRELLKLFEYNSKNKVMITTISNFIVDFVNVMFDIVNEEKEDDIEVKRFKYIISTSAREVEERSSVRIVEGLATEHETEKTEEELKAEEDERIDAIEEREALDVDFDPEDAAEGGEYLEIPYDQLGRNFEDYDAS
jgi:hypothetical protein